MASKSAQQEPEKGEVIEALLDDLDLLVERVKVLYEQYFLGIQKQPPSFLHTDIERKLRDLSQHQIRNTALRYRFVTLQQKFGAYHAYWRRTLRQIENGTYTRSLSKLGRQAARTGEDIPEEILAAMPKRMREQIRRDREAALANASRRQGAQQPAAPQQPATPPPQPAAQRHPPSQPPAIIVSPNPFETEDDTAPRNTPLPRARTPVPFHLLEDADDSEFDVDSMFAAISSDDLSSTIAATRAKQQPAAPPAARAPEPPPPRPPAAAPPAPAPPAPVRASSMAPTSRESRPIPTVPRAGPQTPPAGTARVAPSQQTRSIPIVAGSSTSTRAEAPADLPGPFAREPAKPPAPAPAPTAAAAPAPAPKPPAPKPPVPAPAPPAAAKPIPPPIPPLPGKLPPLVPPPIPPMPKPVSTAIPVIPPVAAKPQPKAPTPTPTPTAKPTPTPKPSLPPGMTDADVNALYAKYVKAKEMVGEKAGPGAYGKLVQTINSQAPKIIEQYKAKAVDFSVVVKDNQVIIRAKPKP